MKQLFDHRLPADIPNTDGYRLIGIDDDFNEFFCVVRKNPVGCFSLYKEENSAPCFMQIKYWRPLK